MTVTLLRLPEVCKRIGVTRGTVYRWMSLGLFPRSRAVGPNTRAWVASEIEEWLAQLPAGTADRGRRSRKPRDGGGAGDAA